MESRVAGIGTDFADNQYHVGFRLPMKWKVVRQTRFEDGGDRAATITTYDAESKLDVGIYYRLETRSVGAAAIDDALRQEIGKKVNLRTRQGLKNYAIKDGDCGFRMIGDRRALACIATFSSGKESKSEYLTWVRSWHCLLQVWVQARTDQLAGFRNRIEALLQSLEIP